MLLPAIPHLRLRITLRAQAPAVLPPYKGSLLRGIFGHALRRTVCVMGPEQPCATCSLRPACVYTRVFETFLEGEPPPFLKGLTTAPRPYVLEPRDDRRTFAPGDPLEFDLLLFGQALTLHAYALLALQRGAASGLGKDRVPFHLDHVLALGPEGTWHPILTNGRSQGPAALPPSLHPAPPIPTGRLTLHLLTPTRLKSHNRLAEPASFRLLAFAMLRRTFEMAHVHVPGSPLDWNLRPLLDQADTIRIPQSDLTWRDWSRYSNRQKTKIDMGGFVGTLHLEGDLAPFLPLLRMAELLHVGKGTTLGLGRMAIEVK